MLPLQPPITRRLAAGLLAATGFMAAIAVHAQAQPLEGGPLHIVVGYAPGGATDRVARVVGDKLSARLGVPVIVDNKPGAGGRLAVAMLKAYRAQWAPVVQKSGYRP